MRLVIIGGVAGGATAAARARRISEKAQITIVERGPYVSFANCGLPYHISGDIRKRSRLLLQTPEGFDSRYAVTVRVQTEALEIDRAARRVLVKGPGGEEHLGYDKLILAQGGRPIVPPVGGAGSANVFTLWSMQDMDRINEFLEESRPTSAVIAGGGFIGLEMAEAFTKRGLATAVVELLPRLMPTLDPEISCLIRERLESHGVRVIVSRGIRAVHAGRAEVELDDGTRGPGGIVLLAAGVRPETALARAAGLALGKTGAVLVDEHMQTSDPDIFAVGDMVEVVHRVHGAGARVPLAGPANRQGRVAASNALGIPMRYAGALGTSVVKIFEAVVSSTGLTETAARSAGLDVGAAVVVRDHHAGYYPGAREMYLKLVYERPGGRLLGAQAFGEEGVEKRIDVAATALVARMTLQDLADLDLAYAPPFSSANDPLNVAAFVGLNDLSGFSPAITASSLKRMLEADGGPPLLLDVRTLNEFEASHLRGALHIPLDELRFRLDEVPRGRVIVLYCRSGYRAHLALRILRDNGFQNVMNVTGGFLSILREGGFELEEAPKEAREGVHS